jgi:hypothetical protein
MIFFYLGILLFLFHMYLFGIGLDLSYFALGLIYIGWMKPILNNWFYWLLWFFIFLEIYANIREIYRRITLSKSAKKNVRFETDIELV